MELAGKEGLGVQYETDWEGRKALECSMKLAGKEGLGVQYETGLDGRS